MTLPTSDIACQSCTVEDRLKKIEDLLAAIQKIVDQTAKTVSEIKKYK